MQRAIQYQQQQQEKETTNHGNDRKDNDNDDDNDVNQNDKEESPEVLLEKNQRKEYKRARKILDTLGATTKDDV